MRATAILEAALLAQGLDGISNGQFIERVRADFGDDARQHVQLDSSHRGAPRRMLLQPLAGAASEAIRKEAAAVADAGADTGADTGADIGQLVALLRRVEHLLQEAQPQLSRLKAWGRPNGGLQAPSSQSLQSSTEQNR